MRTSSRRSVNPCCVLPRCAGSLKLSRIQTHLPRARVLGTRVRWTSAKVLGREICGPGALLCVLGPWSLGHRCSVTAPGAALPSRGGHAQPPGREYRPLLLCSLLKATPKVPTTPVKAKRVSTFQEFESNTSDAWDAGEDDDELLAMAAESLNTAVVMETAHRVLRNHSQQQGRSRPPGAPEPPAEPPEAPGGDLRLVKSVSESHASCPEGGGGGEGRVVGGGASGFPERGLEPSPPGMGRGGSQPSEAQRSSSRGPPGQQRQLRFLSSSWLGASPS